MKTCFIRKCSNTSAILFYCSVFWIEYFKYKRYLIDKVIIQTTICLYEKGLRFSLFFRSRLFLHMLCSWAFKQDQIKIGQKYYFWTLENGTVLCCLSSFISYSIHYSKLDFLSDMFINYTNKYIAWRTYHVKTLISQGPKMH